MEAMYWYLSVLASSILSFGIGFQFVAILRKKCRTMRNIRRFTTRWTNRTIADAISFGIVFGILLQLAMKPRGPGSIKLIAKQIDGKHADVWLDSLELTAGEVRQRIADALSIQPITRISIESGKGNFIEDLNQPMFDNIDDTLKNTDFFGYLTISCYIHVKEEEKKKIVDNDNNNPDNSNVDGKGKKTFLGILGNKEVKYGEFLVCSAKIATSIDAKVNFQISCIDRFVAGAPSTLLLNSTTIRFHPWSSASASGVSGGAGSGGGTTGEENGDNASETGESVSVGSRGVAQSSKKRSSIFFRTEKGDYFGNPLRNGDIVVLETNGKYMSVTRGWWMAWNSNEPRRSGAFRIQIVDKAHSQFKEQIKNIKDNIKEKMNHLVKNNSNIEDNKGDKEKEFDPILRPGDSFRLISLKFPDFELGLTSVKIRDEYCYLGLRKIGSTEAPSEDDAWCMEVNFQVRNANDILNIIRKE